MVKNVYYLECPPLNVNRIEFVKDTIDAWMRSSALLNLMKSFGSDIPLNLDTEELVNWLLNYSERWDFRRLQAMATAKDTGEAARWLVNDLSFTELQRSIIKETSKQLGLIGVEIPSKNSYDFILILGGARLSCLLRPRLAANLVKKLSPQIKAIVLLASGRPVALSEREATNTYAPNAKTEFDLINAGAEISFKLKGIYTEESNNNVMDINKKWIIRKYETPNNLPPILSISAPSTEPEKRRANSADTYEFFFKNYNVSAGSSLLLITSQIYVPYQQLEAIRTVALKNNVTVETVGFPPEWAGNLHGLTTPSNYLQEIRSTIQSASRFLTSLQQNNV